MSKEMIAFLSDLADVIERHKGGIAYTVRDDGVYATLNGCWVSKVNIGWPSNGDVSKIRRVISNSKEQQ